MNGIRITFLRHAVYGKDGASINLNEYGRCYFTGLEIAKLGNVDAVYSSFSGRAFMTGLIVATATNCHNRYMEEKLDEEALLSDLLSVIAQAKEEAQKNGWKHLVFVMHLPCLRKLGARALQNLDFICANNVDFDVKITSEFEQYNMLFVERNYPELSRLLDEKLQLLSDDAIDEDQMLFECVEKFHKFRDWQAVTDKIKTWKRFFLDAVGISNLDETADWSEILTHSSCEEIDLMAVAINCSANISSFSWDNSVQLNMLPEYQMARRPGEYMSELDCFDLGGIGSHRVMGALIKKNDNRTSIFSVEALVSEGYAQMMKGVNPLIIIADMGIMCSFSYRAEISPFMERAQDTYYFKQYEQNPDLPF